MAHINMRIDGELKEESKEILDALGLDLTKGITLFLKQVVLKNGIPFELTLNKPYINQALEDVESGNVQTFSTLEELMKDLNDGD